VPATPPGDESRDPWSRGPSARHGRDPDDPAGWSRDGDEPGTRAWSRDGDEPGAHGWSRDGDEPGTHARSEPASGAWDRGGFTGQRDSAPAPGPYAGVDTPTEVTPVIRVSEPSGDASSDAPPPEQPVQRSLSLAVAGLAGLLTAGLTLGAMITHSSYAVVIFGVQVLFVLAWTVASRPPAPRVVAGVGMAAAGAADLAAVLVDEASLAPLAYVTAAAVIVGVIGQLTRPAGRVRVTESLGSTLTVVVGVVAFTSLVTLSRHPRGAQAIVACLAAAGVAVIVARLVDVVAPVPRLAPQVPRGGAGIVVGAMVGTAVAAGAGSALDGLSTGPTAVAGLVTALVAVVVDLTVNYAEAGRAMAGEPPALWLARHVQGPLAAFALAAPAAYASATLLLNTL
jgi:hypothetical protein